MNFTFLLFLLYAFATAIFALDSNNEFPAAAPHRSQRSNNPQGFWLSTELRSSGFRKGCLSTALCHKAVFKIIHTMTLNGESTVLSWPLTQQEQERESRSLVTHWIHGDPVDISLSCQVAGTDPTFGFTRVCDETPSRMVFNGAAIRLALAARSREDSSTEEQQLLFGEGVKLPGLSTSSNAEDVDQVLIDLRGRCFNATIAIRKFEKRCPWCPDPNVDIVVGASSAGQTSDSSSENQLKRNSADLFLHNCVILALCGAVVFAISGLCCVIFVHCRYRYRNSKRQTRGGGGGKRNMIGNSTTKKRTLLKVLGPPPQLPTQMMAGKQQQQHSPPTPSIVKNGGTHHHPAAVDNNREHNQHQQQLMCSDDPRYEYETPWDNCWPIYHGSTGQMMVPAHMQQQQKMGGGYQCVQSPFNNGGTINRNNLPSSRKMFNSNAKDLLVASTVCFERESTSARPLLSCRHPPPPPMPFPHNSTFSQERSGSSLGRTEDSGLESI